MDYMSMDLYGADEEQMASRTPLDETKQQKIRVRQQSLPHRSFSLPDEDIYTANDEKPIPSAPLNITTFNIKVDWSGPFPTRRWKALLEKALQTWCKSCLSKEVGKPCDIFRLKLMDDPSCAEVQISPSEALEALKNVKTVALRFKDLDKEVTAWILLNEPHSVTVSQNPASMLDKEEVLSPKVSIPVPETPAVAQGPQLTLPIYLYWYMHHAYRKELQRIEEQHGVTISAEVLISVNPKQGTSLDLVSKASEDFQKLVNGCVDNFSSATIPHTHMDSDIVKETLHNIQSEDTKMMITMSASNCLLFGPQHVTSMINRKCDSEDPKMASQLKDKSRKMEEDSSVFSQSWTHLDIDIKDLQNQLEIDKVHWDLMKLTYKEQLLHLETKYGVSFHSEKLHNNLTVKVRAQSKENQYINLERHALRALMHLYQKLAKTTITCALKNHQDAGVVAKTAEKLCMQHYCVVAVDGPIHWSLTGLPEHLGPAITDIEKTLGKNVFDEKTKQLIGSTQEKISNYGQGAAGRSV